MKNKKYISILIICLIAVGILVIYISKKSNEKLDLDNAKECYGKRVNFYSENDESIIWRIYFIDNQYVYLISSKKDGDYTNQINLSKSSDIFNGKLQYKKIDGSEYTGTANITDKFLQSLNGKWFTKTSKNSTSENAKAVAFLMDQNQWSKYNNKKKDASYIIGSPTIELLEKSYNKVYGTSVLYTDINKNGYNVDNSIAMQADAYTYNGIYINGKDAGYVLASPSGGFNYYGILYVQTLSGEIGDIPLSTDLGIKPIVIIDRKKFINNFKILTD